jgi:hypothetical protein
MYLISVWFKDHAADQGEVQATIERLDAEIAMASECVRLDLSAKSVELPKGDS